LANGVQNKRHASQAAFLTARVLPAPRVGDHECGAEEHEQHGVASKADDLVTVGAT